MSIYIYVRIFDQEKAVIEVPIVGDFVLGAVHSIPVRLFAMNDNEHFGSKLLLPKLFRTIELEKRLPKHREKL